MTLPSKNECKTTGVILHSVQTNRPPRISTFSTIVDSQKTKSIIPFGTSIRMRFVIWSYISPYDVLATRNLTSVAKPIHIRWRRLRQREDGSAKQQRVGKIVDPFYLDCCTWVE